jgi:hypothetical protein
MLSYDTRTRREMLLIQIWRGNHINKTGLSYISEAVCTQFQICDIVEVECLCVSLSLFLLLPLGA